MARKTLAAVLMSLFTAVSLLPAGARGASLGSAGKSIGEKSSSAAVATGNFFKKTGLKIGDASKKVFDQQGKFWKKVGCKIAGSD
jgi:hypothetical protein